MLPTGINWKAADRAYRQGYEEGMRQLEQIRRGRGKRLRIEGMYLPLWQAEWSRHRWREAARFQLAPRLWRSLRAAA